MARIRSPAARFSASTAQRAISDSTASPRSVLVTAISPPLFACRFDTTGTGIRLLGGPRAGVRHHAPSVRQTPGQCPGTGVRRLQAAGGNRESKAGTLPANQL